MNVGHLDVSDCSIELGTVMAFLGRQNPETFQLRGISVSGNPANSAIPAVTLPPSLTKFVAHVVFFTESTLLSMVDILFTASVFVDLSYAIAEREKWAEVFEHLEHIHNPKILRLAWVNNPVSPLFFGFLGRCQNLVVLNISGCLSVCHPVFEEAVEFMARNRIIHKLLVCGSRKNRLSGAALLRVVSILRQNQVISAFDFHENPVSDTELLEIAEILVANRGLKKVRFSLTGITRAEAMEEFWERLNGRPGKLEVMVNFAEMQISVNEEQLETWNRMKNERARGVSCPVSEIHGENKEWQIRQPELPIVHDQELIEQRRDRFAIPSLLARLRGTQQVV
jgi:hypothetical protein